MAWRWYFSTVTCSQNKVTWILEFKIRVLKVLIKYHIYWKCVIISTYNHCSDSCDPFRKMTFLFLLLCSSLRNFMPLLPSMDYEIELVKKCSTLHETRSFAVVFMRACHWNIPWANWIQSTFSHPIYSWHILIWPHLRLRLPNGISTNILYAFLISPCMLHVPFISLFLTWSPK
jgi:hypothetical protein